MDLWTRWLSWCAPLRQACSRQRTWLWTMAVLAAFCARPDLLGVTSFVRALGLSAACYGPLLALFHSKALNLDKLTRLWAAHVAAAHPGAVRCNGRLVLLVDGIKIPKAGRKMPAVKRLHQSSESNNKPEFIMGHSCQAAALLVHAKNSAAAIPLAARIHEGLVFSNRDRRTLLDKMMELVTSLGLIVPFYCVGDAYYATRKMANPLLEQGNHLVTRVRSNAVAYFPAPAPERKKRGRPKLYGNKILLKSLFDDLDEMLPVQSPVYGERGVQLRLRALDLLWRPVGILVRFVAVWHPSRGRCILMSTDLTLEPIDIVRLYGYRFKIEVAFKQSLHVVGAFLHHFWMAGMKPQKRNGGNRYLHRETKQYRDAVRRKMDAYHRFIQLGLIAQGIMAALATTEPALVRRHFGSWFRTERREKCPSERIVAQALQNTLPEFLADSVLAPILTKFLRQRLDPKQIIAKRIAA